MDAYVKQIDEGVYVDKAQIEQGFKEITSGVNAKRAKYMAVIAFAVTTTIGFASIGQISASMAAYATIALIGIALLVYLILGIPETKVSAALSEVTWRNWS